MAYFQSTGDGRHAVDRTALKDLRTLLLQSASESIPEREAPAVESSSVAYEMLQSLCEELQRKNRLLEGRTIQMEDDAKQIEMNHTSAVQHYHDIISDLQVALVGKDTQCSEVGRKYERACRQIDSLQDDAHRHDDRASQLLSKHTAELDTLQGQLATLQQTHDTTAAEAALLRRSVRQAEDTSRALQQAVVALQAHVRAVEEERDGAAATHRRREEELERTLERASAASTEATRALAELGEDKRRTDARAAALEENVLQAERQRVAMARAADARAEELEGKARRAEARAAAVEEQAARAATALEGKMEAMEEEAAGERVRLRTLQEALSTCREEARALAEEAGASAVGRDTAEALAEEREETARAAKAALAERTEEAVRWERRCVELQDRLTEKTRALSAQSAELDDLRTSAAEHVEVEGQWTEERRKMASEVRALRRRCSHLEAANETATEADDVEDIQSRSHGTADLSAALSRVNELTKDLAEATDSLEESESARASCREQLRRAHTELDLARESAASEEVRHASALSKCKAEVAALAQALSSAEEALKTLGSNIVIIQKDFDKRLDSERQQARTREQEQARAIHQLEARVAAAQEAAQHESTATEVHRETAETTAERLREALVSGEEWEARASTAEAKVAELTATTEAMSESLRDLRAREGALLEREVFTREEAERLRARSEDIATAEGRLEARTQEVVRREGAAEEARVAAEERERVRRGQCDQQEQALARRAATLSEDALFLEEHIAICRRCDGIDVEEDLRRSLADQRGVIDEQKAALRVLEEKLRMAESTGAAREHEMERCKQALEAELARSKEERARAEEARESTYTLREKLQIADARARESAREAELARTRMRSQEALLAESNTEMARLEDEVRYLRRSLRDTTITSAATAIKGT